MKESQRIRIKMCGTTSLEDALAAVEAGVDALGFIFYEKSPRSIEPRLARIIIEQLPPFVDTVGVFVDRNRKEVEEIIRFCSLGYVQLHGNESPKYCERLVRFAAPCQVLKALRVSAHLHAKDLAPYNDHVKGFVLDTYQANLHGGTGKIFDWSLIAGLNLQRDFILAGGLHQDNVEQALMQVQPYALDVNSGVEERPGSKDHAKIRAFVRQVRRIEEGLDKARKTESTS
jgi:phosphoribosylanthranilate isomerase